MAKSERVRAADVLAASTLAAEAREIAHARGSWQMHVARGIATLFDAQVGCVPEVEIISRGVMVLRRTNDYGDWTPSDRATFLAYLEDPEAEDPTIARMLPLQNKIVCARRDDLVPDDEWYATRHYNEYRSKGRLDPVMFGFVPSADPNWFVGMGVHRPVGAPSFDRAAPVIFRVLCDGLAELCRVVGPPGAPLARVPPRRRAVLERLLAGDSERQAAMALGMSEHAVHAHVKALHKQFGVNSRGELLSRFIEHGASHASK